MVWHAVHEAVFMKDLPRLCMTLRADPSAVFQRSAYGGTPLMVAAAEGMLPFVEALLDADAPCDVRDDQGKCKCVRVCVCGWVVWGVGRAVQVRPSVRPAVTEQLTHKM